MTDEEYVNASIEELNAKDASAIHYMKTEGIRIKPPYVYFGCPFSTNTTNSTKEDEDDIVDISDVEF